MERSAIYLSASGFSRCRIWIRDAGHSRTCVCSGGWFGWIPIPCNVDGWGCSPLPSSVHCPASRICAAGFSADVCQCLDGRSPTTYLAAQSLVGKWMRWVLQMAQGRDLIEQMQREAQESHLPELIGMSVQLEFIRRGTAQQELMGQLATSIAADYIGNSEQRAEKVGAELVIPMVIFYFLPFLVTLLAVIGWPIVQNLGTM